MLGHLPMKSNVPYVGSSRVRSQLLQGHHVYYDVRDTQIDKT